MASMRISPRFRAEDWRALDLNDERNWPRAVEIFEDRIDGRFLTPIRTILCWPWSGFAVLALDSLLVETLQQFWEGVERTPTVNKKGCACATCECKRLVSRDYFRAFLCGDLFPKGFTSQTAELFYTTVRCGILHQAQVTGTTRVRRSAPLVAPNRPQHTGATPKASGITINPVKFHNAIEGAVKRYAAILRDPTQKDRRKHFCNKMDAIASAKDDDVQG